MLPVTMPPCIFCSKSYNRLHQGTPYRTRFGMTRSSEARRIAVPIFNGRVSPVLDTCTQLCMVESSGASPAANRTLPMKSSSIYERSGEMIKYGVQIIICGAVSEAFYNLLTEAGIDLVCGVTGDVDEVIAAHRNGTLNQPRFRMPGTE